MGLNELYFNLKNKITEAFKENGYNVSMQRNSENLTITSNGSEESRGFEHTVEFNVDDARNK